MNKRQKKKRVTKVRKLLTSFTFITYCYQSAILAHKRFASLGISFTDDQKRKICNYCDGGKIEKAQEIILRELDRNYCD